MTSKSGKRLRRLVGKRTTFTDRNGREFEGVVRFKKDWYFFVIGSEERKVDLHANYSSRNDRTRVYDRRLFETKEQLELYKERQGQR